MHWPSFVRVWTHRPSRRVPLQQPPPGYEVSLMLPIPGPTDQKLRRIKVAFLVPATLVGYWGLLSIVRPGYSRRRQLLLEWLLSLVVSKYIDRYFLTPVHEETHALALWMSTRERPLVSSQPDWSFACAPGWWFPRNHYLVVLLLPVALLTAIMLALLPVMTSRLLPLLGWLIVRNVAGSNADLYVAWRLLKSSANVYLHDTGQVFTFWEPTRIT